MSSNDNDQIKKLKIEDEKDGEKKEMESANNESDTTSAECTGETSEEFTPTPDGIVILEQIANGQDDSEGIDESYLYNSDEYESFSEMNSEDEADYFGETQEETSEDSEKSQVAWEDSTDEEKLGVKNTDSWINSKGLKKEIIKKKKTINFVFKRSIFNARCKIKILRVFGDLKVVVDTFNLIYIFNDFKEARTYKIDCFKISDCTLYQNRLLFSSETSAVIYDLEMESGSITPIKKSLGNISKMISGDHLYTIGEKLSVLSNSLTVINKFAEEFKDMCVLNSENETVLCLNNDGDIYQFDKNLKLIKKQSHPERFRYKTISANGKNVFVGTETGIVILDLELNILKEFRNLQSKPTGFVTHESFTVYSSESPNSLRIIKDDLSLYDRFPFSKVKLPPTSQMAIEKNTVYISSGKFLSSLSLKYN